jgi:DNA-binding response OmpR family regulator
MIGTAISRDLILQKTVETRKNVMLAISSDVEDHKTVRGILDGSEWHALACKTYGQARPLLREASAVLCEQNLPDGDWKRVLRELQNMLDPQRLLVMSRLADSQLWAEVLNLGGYDVLAKPLRAQELLWTIATIPRSPSAPNRIEKDYLLSDKEGKRCSH